jgi:hypothetical protein
MGFFLCTACSCISSCKIPFCMLPTSSLYVRHFWSSIPTGVYGSISFFCALVGPKMKYLNLAALLFPCNLSHGTLLSRWLNRFKVGDRSSSTSRTRNLPKTTNMGLLHLMPTKAWQNWLPGTLCHQTPKLRKSSHYWLVSRSWRMRRRRNSLGHNSWCSSFRDEFNRYKICKLIIG